jgi:hypothetical protein
MPVIIRIARQRGDHTGRRLPPSLACEGLLHYKAAPGRSPRTIGDCNACFKKLLLFFVNDPPIDSIDRYQIVAF